MDRLELAKAKRRFQETYEYIKESVKRGNVYPVPSCFMENSFGTDPARVPNSVFSLIKIAIENEDKNLITWLASFDLEPMKKYCETFGSQAYPFGDEITDIEYLIGDLADFHAWIEETQGDGQTLGNCDIVHNDEAEANPIEQAHQEEAKEFARLFMEGGEKVENVGHALEILEHIKPLRNADIAVFLCRCKYKGQAINRDIQDKEIWRWLNEHCYKVASYQAFNQAMRKEAGR